MHVPPSRPQTRPFLHEPSWRDLVATYLMALALPVLVWAVSHPVAGAASLLGLVGLHRLYRLARARLRRHLRRGALRVRLGRTAQLTISGLETEACRPDADCC